LGEKKVTETKTTRKKKKTIIGGNNKALKAVRVGRDEY